MGGLGDYYENVALDCLLGGDRGPLLPATVYLALFSVACTDSVFGTELSGSGYARVAISNNTSKWPAASGGQKSNADAQEFPVATGTDWDPIVGWALMDHITDATIDNVIFHNEISPSKLVTVGDIATFPIGTIVLGAD